MSGPNLAAHSFTNTIYAISATLPATFDAAGYGSTAITYTTIGRVEQFPEFGATREVQKFTPINGSVEYAKGTPEFGSGQLIVADIPSDAGQVILRAADASTNQFSIKITYPDNEIHYLSVLVSSWQLAQSQSGQFKKRTATINISRPPVIVAAA